MKEAVHFEKALIFDILPIDRDQVVPGSNTGLVSRPAAFTGDNKNYVGSFREDNAGAGLAVFAAFLKGFILFFGKEAAILSACQ